MKRYLTGGIATLCACLSLAVASGANAAEPADTNVERMTPALLERMISDSGYNARVDKDSQGDPMIIADSVDDGFTVMFFGCEKSGGIAERLCTDVEFSAAYTVDRRPALAKLNQWNTEQGFGKVYLRDDGKVVLEMPLNLADRVSESFVISSLEWWYSTLNTFDQYMWPK